MSKVELQYDLDITAFMAKMEKVGATLAAVDDKLQAGRSTRNPFVSYNQSAQAFNASLGQQVQLYQRNEAAANSFRNEQKRLEAQLKDLKSRQLEFIAAGRYGELRTQIAQVQGALSRMNAPLIETNSLWDRLKAKFSGGLTIPRINTPRTTPAAGGTGAGGSALGNVAGLAVDELAGAAGVSLSAAGAVAAVGAVVVKSTQEWAAYGKKLSEVSAITGATGKALQYLDDQALEIEADTGLAGTTVLDAFKSIGSIKPELLENKELLTQTTKEVIALSQASGLDLQQSAISLLGSINQFGEGADQAGRFANVLAAGAKFGASEINETSQALQNSGTAMKAAGVSFEQGNALIQSLAGVMIKGSEAGTGLRNVLLKLETSSDKNLRPSVVGLDAALENASKKFTTTTSLTKEFGVENIVVARRILDTRGEITKLTTDITGTAVAYEQARINTNNLATDLDKAGTSISAFFRSLGSSQDGALRTITQSFTTFVNSLASKTGTVRAFFSEVFSLKNFATGTGIAEGVAAAIKQRQANQVAEARKAEYDGITKQAVASVTEQIKQLQATYQQQGETVPQAQRMAAAKEKEVRDAEYQQARADHNRIRKEYEQAGADQKASFDKQFDASRKRILSAQQAKKQADSEVTRLAKADKDQAAALASALGEEPTDAQKKADKDKKKLQDENNRLLLDAHEDYLKEAQKLETEFGKERLESLKKDGVEYVNLRAELDQKELKVKRDFIERKLQLDKSDKTQVVNGKRVVVADTSVTLENSAPGLAKQFSDSQQRIENERAREVKLIRVREEYDLLELAKKSDDNELALFDKFWEQKLLTEKEGSAKYVALVQKRNRDRNTLVIDQTLKDVKDGESAALAFTDSNAFEKNARQEDPSLNADQIDRLREERKLQIRIDAGKRTLDFLKAQGEKENAVLIAQTQTAVDELEKQQKQLQDNKVQPHDIFDILGITDGLNTKQLDAFRKATQDIGAAIQQTTQLIIDQSNQRIQAIDSEIQAKQQQVDEETARQKEGAANNLSIRAAELEELKRQKAEETQTRQEALKVQQALDAASAISSAAVTVQKGVQTIASLAAGSAELGPIAGPIVFIASVASILAALYGAFAKVKALTSSQSATQLRDGGRIPLSGKTHEQGGHQIEGTDIFVERGEHVTNARSSEEFNDVLVAINKNDRQGAFRAMLKRYGVGVSENPQYQVALQTASQPAPVVDFSALAAEMKEHKELTRTLLEHIAELPKSQITGLADGRMVEKSKHKTTISKP